MAAAHLSSGVYIYTQNRGRIYVCVLCTFGSKQAGRQVSLPSERMLVTSAKSSERSAFFVYLIEPFVS